MASDDDKAFYSKKSASYIEDRTDSEVGYNKSKEREAKHNADWETNKVDLNKVIEKFAPNYDYKTNGSKMIFYGVDYNVVADMASGYLRIYDNKKKRYIQTNGKPGTEKETHYKIKRRKEM